MEKFEKMGLSPLMLKALAEKGFEEPTPIQQKVIPGLLTAERDIVGQAQTGTGKTAAFGIPIIERLHDKAKHVQALVLAPTRELAIQVAEELNSLKGKRKLRVIPIYGGQSIDQQFKRLKQGVDIIAGTPGRILDHLNRGTLKLDRVSFVVLDEADEMLNMGFIEDVKSILDSTSEERITLLFSATMPREIMKVAKKYMKDYELIKTTPQHVTTDLTDQIYFEVSRANKFEALCRIIDVEDDFYGLVFCRTKVDVNEVAKRLTDRGYAAEGIHGDISQSQRENVLGKFKSRRVNILVATDVAARGIDINNLTHVINYSIPQDPEAYVHRIGRTGRAGREGTAITFVTPAEIRRLMVIKKAARTQIRREKIPKVREVIEAKRSRIRGIVEKATDNQLPGEFIQLANELLEQHSPEKAIAALLHHTFQDELNPRNYNEIRDGQPTLKGKTRLFVGIGKRDNMSKRKLVQLINTKVGVDGRRIDDVQVLDGYSFITVPFKDAEAILRYFKTAKRRERVFVEVARKSRKGKRS